MGNYTPNPNNHPNQVALLDDATPPNAAALNTPSEAALDLTAYIEAHGTMGHLVSMYPSISTGGPFTGAGPYAFVFNDRPPNGNEPTAQSWLVAGYNAGDIFVYWIAGEDTTWTQYGLGLVSSNGATDLGVATTGSLWLASTDGSHINTWRSAPGSGGWTSFASNLVGSCTDAKIAQAPNGSGTAVYLAAGSSVAGNALLGFATDGGSDGFFGGFTATTWLLKSNGSYGLAIPAQAAANQQAYKSNAAGTVWTGTIIGLNAADIPVDLAWNAVQSLWLLATRPLGAGNGVAFWTSPDGVNWTKVAQLANVNTAQAVAAVGPYFFFLDSDAGSAPKMRLFGCRDGGVTWSQSQARVIGTAGSNFGKLAAGPNQLAMAPTIPITAGAPANTMIRFSHCSGMSDAVVT